MQRSGIVVVIATYNEADNIEQILSGLSAYRVVLVDDGSPDGTAALARRFSNVRVIDRGFRRGIASAYVDGFLYALHHFSPDFIVQMDAGLTHDAADIPRLLNRTGDADLVIGSRFLRSRPGLTRRVLLSLTAAWLMRRLSIQVGDATSGFRCWRAHHLQRILNWHPPRSQGFAFQLEMLYWAMTLGGAVQEVAIPYRFTRSSFTGKMLWEAAKAYLRLTWRKLTWWI